MVSYHFAHSIYISGNLILQWSQQFFPNISNLSLTSRIAFTAWFNSPTVCLAADNLVNMESDFELVICQSALYFYSISSFICLSSVEEPKKRGQNRPFLAQFFSRFSAKATICCGFILYFLFNPQFRIIIIDLPCVECVIMMAKRYSFLLADLPPCLPSYNLAFINKPFLICQQAP